MGLVGRSGPTRSAIFWFKELLYSFLCIFVWVLSFGFDWTFWDVCTPLEANE
jgi:hypothetical protein